MKFEKGKNYYDARTNSILKFTHKYNGKVLFVEQEIKNGTFKTWGNLKIAKRVYNEIEANKLSVYN